MRTLAACLGCSESDVGVEFARDVATRLSASPMLTRLRALQGAFDPIDIEGLGARFRDAHDQQLAAAAIDELSPVATLRELEAVADRFAPGGDGDPALATLRDLELAYLLSASFKDCSVFVRVVADEPTVVKAVDVDMKLLARLPAYARLDRDICAVVTPAASKRWPACIA